MMFSLRHFLACVTLLVLAASTRAEAPPDPLRLMPNQADLLIKVEHPPQLVHALFHNELVQRLRAFDIVKELEDSTNAHRLEQLIAYVEKELDCDRWKLLRHLTGGGAAWGIKFGPQPVPQLFIIQGDEERLSRRFFELALDVLRQELARQEAKDRIEKGMYRGVETVKIGKDFHAAVLGSALAVSNRDLALRLAVDLYRDGDRKSLAHVAGVGEAHKLAGSEAIAWSWLNLETVRKAPGAKKNVFSLPRDDPQLTILFGGWLDVAGRSPFLAGGLYPEESGLRLSLRMPRGREGMPAALAVHVQPTGQPGCRPLLEPPGVLYSTSYYLDLAQFWNERNKLFNAKQVKTFEDFDQKTKQFLAGANFSKLLNQLGVYQRIVVADQAKTAYKNTPTQVIPAFAAVLELREAESFRKRAETIIRTGAVLASLGVKLKPLEEKHDGVKILGYRFVEDTKATGDGRNYLLNFSPCFATVGNQFIASSTVELCRDLVDLVKKEPRDSLAGIAAAGQSQVYASGVADLLRVYQDRLLTQAMLDQALPPDQAKQQVQAFIEFVRRLGVLHFEQEYGARDFRYDVRLWLEPGSRGN
jgi:hypothetical protein